jgi:hypothetical protein
MTAADRRRVRMSQVAGLAVLVITGLGLGVYASSSVAEAADGAQVAAIVFSTLCGVVAVFAMFIDLSDLWLRGRRLPPRSARLLRYLAIIAMLSAMATSLLGGNGYLPVALLPAAAVHYFAVRPSGVRRRPGQDRVPQGSAASAAARSRQRRGGRKRR